MPASQPAPEIPDVDITTFVLADAGERVAVEDPPLQFLQVLCRVDSHLVDELPTCPCVGAQGFPLPPRPVEGEHVLAAEAFVERVVGDEALELTEAGAGLILVADDRPHWDHPADALPCSLGQLVDKVVRRGRLRPRLRVRA